MSTEVGLWIDHRQAILVTMTAEEVKIKEIQSAVETQPRRSGDSPLKGRYEAVQTPADNRLQRTLTEHLNIYYAAVTDYLRDARSIFIFGPGEAKQELREHLEREHLGGRIAGIETVDKMTDPQIVAKVRQHFAPTQQTA